MIKRKTGNKKKMYWKSIFEDAENYIIDLKLCRFLRRLHHKPEYFLNNLKK